MINVAGIPVEIFGNIKDARMIIFCLHGRKSSLKRMSDFCIELSRINHLAIVSFDSANHGSRITSKTSNNSWNEGNINHALDLYSLMLANVSDISLLMDYLCIIFQINANVQWGVAGFSLGGHSALLALCHEPRLNIAISILGCADFASLMTDRASKTNLEYLPNPIFSDAFLQLIKMKDPINNINAFQGKNLLLISGSLDYIVPVYCNNAFVSELENAGYNYKNIILDINHEMSSEINTIVKDWLLKLFIQF